MQVSDKFQELRKALLACEGGDPVLDYEYMAADAGVSISTFKRKILPYLPIVQITDRRRGCLRSNWEAHKRKRLHKPQSAAS